MCDDRLIGLEPPVAPAKPPMAMPGLYHLRCIVPDNVEVPWKWNYDSGDEFVST